MDKTIVNSILYARKLCKLYENGYINCITQDKDLYNSYIENLDGLTASVVCYKLPYKKGVLKIYMMYRNFDGFDLDLCIDEVRAAIELALDYPCMYEPSLVEFANECKSLLINKQ